MSLRSGRRLGARVMGWVERLRSSLWALPLSQVAGTVALAILTLWLDHEYGSDLAWRAPFDVGADGIRTTVGTIAGSILTVAGVAFSITVVVLQLASSQYSPRVIRTFRRDRLIQIVLGLYTSTFVYAVLVLRTISDGDDDGGGGFVAPISVSVTMVLAIGCMIALIALVHHIAHQVQASTVVNEIAEETRAAISSLFPEPLGDDIDAREVEPPVGHGVCTEHCAWRDGYVELIDVGSLDDLRGATLACIVPRVGDYVRRGECVARIWHDAPEETGLDVRGTFVLGTARTIRQDVRYGLHLIVDIALRALSPGINDPSTAQACIDVLGGLLCDLARRRMPSPLRRNEHGLLVYAPSASRAEMLALAFEQIIDAAASSTQVQASVAEALAAVERASPGADFGGALDSLRARIRHVGRSASWYPDDRVRIERLLATAGSGLQARAGAARGS